MRGARGHAQHPLARHRRDASAFAPLRAVPVAAVPSLQPWSLALLMTGVSLLATRTRRRSAD
ncbi:MAG TPA: IPTL-CTERM sorting domain-containing protein [Ottowia sp.]|nr:IPTL-CTERM sorting domain-containing protein [Ottowia sp.]